MRGYIRLLKVAVPLLAILGCDDTPSSPSEDTNGDPPPSIGVTSVEPATAFIGEEFLVTGWGFGAEGTVTHDGAELVVAEWADSTIRVIASDWRQGPLVIAAGDAGTSTLSVRSVGVAYGVEPPEVDIGAEVTITGRGFGDEPGAVRFAGVELPIVSWADETIRAVARGFYADRPLIVDTRDFGDVGTPVITTVVPEWLDLTEYRTGWGELRATLLDRHGANPTYVWILTDTWWTPQLEWDGLSFSGERVGGPERVELEGSVDPSLGFVHGTFNAEFHSEGSGDYRDEVYFFEAGDIPLHRVEADTVEFRLEGDPVISRVTDAVYVWSIAGGYTAVGYPLVREASHPAPVVSVFFTRE